MDIATKELTDKQASFIEALLGEVRGNIRLAMDMAGYSKSTKATEVVGPLKEITERTGLMLAMNAPKAAFGIVCVLHDPAAMGARNAMDLDEDKILKDPKEAVIQAKMMSEIGALMPQQQEDLQQPQGGVPSIQDPTGSGGGNIRPGNAPEPEADGFTGAAGGAHGGNSPPQGQPIQ